MQRAFFRVKLKPEYSAFYERSTKNFWEEKQSTYAQQQNNTAGYFNASSNMLGLNDVIITLSSTGGTPVLSHLYVNANNGSVVDVTDGVVITATDTD